MKRSFINTTGRCSRPSTPDRGPGHGAIIDTADGNACDLIVMASHGRHGIAAVLLGRETVKVLTHSEILVLVHR